MFIDERFGYYIINTDALVIVGIFSILIITKIIHNSFHSLPNQVY